ncbi:MAG: hypothetical protein ACFFDH_12850 [Promethearchaeota archaeon]
MPSCIVCHLDIDENSDSHFKCNNDHPVHKYCLAEWLIHSHSCPLCSEPYSQNLINQFKDYMDKKEQEKQVALDKELELETIKKMQQATKEIIFQKFIEINEKKIEQEQYDEVIEKLLNRYDDNSVDENNLKVLFLLGKANYLKGRYDLAINFLFKLVKIRFDYPEGFLFLGKAYEKLGLTDKAKWAYDRVKESK